MLACACLTLPACQDKKKANTPEAVTEQFAKAFYTADFTHMYQYVNKPSNVVVETLQNSMKDRPEKLEEMRKQEVEFVEIAVESQTDSTAVCSCTAKINGQQRTDKWDLVQENGNWKVTMVMP